MLLRLHTYVVIKDEAAAAPLAAIRIPLVSIGIVEVGVKTAAGVVVSRLAP
jgi:hypothetical protein